MLAHILEGLSLLLHRVVAAAGAEHFDGGCLHLDALAGALALHERTFHGETGTRSDELEHLGVELLHVGHHLHVEDGAAVVQCNEVNGFAAAARAHPAFHTYGCPEVCATE